MDADLLDEKLSGTVEMIDLLDESGKVKFVTQHSSSVDGTMREGSDIDLAIYYDCKDDSEPSQYRFKVVSNLFDDVYDIQIFQQLPLYVRIEVLKRNVVRCRDQHILYDVAWQAIKEFDGFKHRYYDYIGERRIV